MTTVTDVTAFDEQLYRELAVKAKKYYAEMNLTTRIPAAITSKLDAHEYVKGIFDYTQGIKGYDNYSTMPDQAITPRDKRTYELKPIQMAISYSPEDKLMLADKLVQDKQEKMREFARQIDLSVWKGVYTGGFGSDGHGDGFQMVDGVLDQAGAVVDLDGADSALAAQGDVFKALVKMVESIPFRYRANTEVTIGMTSHFYGMANSSLFTFDNGATEWEQFFDKYITKGVKGFKVSRDVIVSDDAFLDSTDTLNTNDRLFAMIPESGIIERAYSRGISMMGEIPNLIGGINQGWGCKLRGCVHDSNAVLYSDQITW